MSFPGARGPDRNYRVDSAGVGLAVYEWGPSSGPVIFMVHGGFDFARTFDVFAPLFADRGWRVVSWDQRCHGDSDQVALHTWEADVRDAVSVMSHVTDQPVPVVGHSKGGALMIQVAESHPFRFSHLINLDGVPSRHRMPDVADHERSKMLAGELTGWLDHRRSLIDKQRKPGTIEDLARRRARMNPRLSREWLEYLVTVGARESNDGWRWKIDPSMRFGGFGPWRPDWATFRLPGLTMPFLGLLATILEEMGWGTGPKDLDLWLPPLGRLEEIPDTGHFLHIERPQLIASKVLAFLEEYS
jgi:pimeloyl-ACP methyl ester carboxylesterase